jgi:hypothetical protein
MERPKDHRGAGLSGGCSCGSIRNELSSPPLWINACHCNACKKRTGSAFGISVVVEQTTVKAFSGTAATFTRPGDSGKPVTYEFCPRCGTTIRWRVELLPGHEIYAAGTLDQPIQFEVVGEFYTNFAWPWARLDCELSCAAEPDNKLRQAMIEKARASRHSAGVGPT